MPLASNNAVNANASTTDVDYFFFRVVPKTTVINKTKTCLLNVNYS